MPVVGNQRIAGGAQIALIVSVAVVDRQKNPALDQPSNGLNDRIQDGASFTAPTIGRIGSFGHGQSLESRGGSWAELLGKSSTLPGDVDLVKRSREPANPMNRQSVEKLIRHDAVCLH